MLTRRALVEASAAKTLLLLQLQRVLKAMPFADAAAVFAPRYAAGPPPLAHGAQGNAYIA